MMSAILPTVIGGIGPRNPEWCRLYQLLGDLAGDTGGKFAFVLDQGNALWCLARPNSPPGGSTAEEDAVADLVYRDEVHPREASMRKGAPFEVVKGAYYAKSFASLYVVGIAFETELQPLLVRSRTLKSLPEIEAMVLALPPNHSPTTTGAAKARA